VLEGAKSTDVNNIEMQMIITRQAGRQKQARDRVQALPNDKNPK